MNADRPRVSPELVSLKGTANATPDVLPPKVEETSVDLTVLSNERDATFTFTFRMKADRRKRLRDAAHENNTSIQAIIDLALKRIGL